MGFCRDSNAGRRVGNINSKKKKKEESFRCVEGRRYRAPGLKTARTCHLLNKVDFASLSHFKGKVNVRG